ncbi:MAG: hypothetical protein IPL61_23975 [Myxococcales bacterium]|nr:hypothetical protein [Myxococcales bacterium]
MDETDETTRPRRDDRAWSAPEVRRKIRHGAVRHGLRLPGTWSGASAASDPRPSEARVLDAADELAVGYLALGDDSPFMIATALLVIDAVAQLRAEHGFVAAPPEDLTAVPRLIAARVFDSVEAEVVARPAMAWAHDLCAQVSAREAAAVPLPPPRRRRRPPLPRPRTFQVMPAQEQQAGRTDELAARVAVALRDAEAQAIVDLRAAVAAGGDPREALAQLAAVARTRRAQRLDRAQLHALVRARVPPC